MSLRNVVLGVVVGAAAAGISALLMGITGDVILSVLSVLAVAVVGLTLGSAAALSTYAVAGVIMIGQAVVTPDDVLRSGDVVRLVSFVIGAPLVVILAMRLERERQATSLARDLSAASEQRAVHDRADADTARRELQAALGLVEQERARLEEVAGAIPEPLVVYDADGRGVYGNRAALRSFGRSFYDRTVVDWGRVADPRDDRGNPLPRERWPQLVARDEPVKLRMQVRLPMSSREVLLDVEGTPLPGGGSVLLLRDVGKEVDERQRLSRFGSFVAHELRNPLAVAKARIELAARERDLPPRVADHGRRALESVDAAIAILERLELFSRAEAGRVEATMEPFRLQDAVRAAIERLRARGSEREVLLLDDADPIITGDRQLTEQALTNLLTNADRYSHEGMPVEIRVGSAVPEVRVSDAGPGIPDEVADRLFHDRVASGRGLGLGLYLVRAAMEAQGGTVLLEERQPRAVFLLRWPGAATPAERKADQPARESVEEREHDPAPATTPPA
jgi:signal transduction histidine kinase